MIRQLTLASLVLGSAAVGVSAQACTGTWSDRFWGGDFDGRVAAFAWSPSGQYLYAGGEFLLAGGRRANRLARWDGTRWEPVGIGVDGKISVLRFFNNDLYLGGEFEHAGGVRSPHIARFDGNRFVAVGTGADGPVDTLTTLNGCLYAAGQFQTVDGVPANNVACYSQIGWAPVGNGLGNAFSRVSELAVVLEGTTPQLWAATAWPSGVSRWDGTAWHSVGQNFGIYIGCLVDTGNGHILAGNRANSGEIFEWDGSTWQEIVRMPGAVYVLHKTGLQVYAGTNNGLWERTGQGWVDVGGLNSNVNALSSDGTTLYAGGMFTVAGGRPACRVAALRRGSWSPVGSSDPGVGPSGSVSAFASYDPDGNGERLHVGGQFKNQGPNAANGLVCWNGQTFESVGSFAGSSPGAFWAVSALQVFSRRLYAAGTFAQVDSVPARNIAVWDGQRWSAVGAGLPSTVQDLVVYDNALYASGSFGIQRWSGAAWVPVVTASGPVLSLVVFGGELVAGGTFSSIGGVSADNIASFDGNAWRPLGGGLRGPAYRGGVYDMAVDGKRELAVGGLFDQAGSVAATNVATWNGTVWSALGAGVGGDVYDTVYSVVYYPGGSLYAGATLNLTTTPTAYLARFDGSAWLEVGGGLRHGGSGWLNRLCIFDPDERGAFEPFLMVGGTFQLAGETSSLNVAAWRPFSQAWTNLGYGLAGFDGAPLLTGTGRLRPGAATTLTTTFARPNALGVLALASHAAPTPFLGGTLVPRVSDVLVVLPTDPSGKSTLAFLWPNVPCGFEMFMQHIVVDAAGVQGVALSNALRAVQQ
ncbi:MAG: hypothetical protein R3F56_01165 [Planctomycetota bacterium]